MAQTQDTHHTAGAAHDHGSYRSYVIGFVLAAILTIIPFGLVMAGGFENRLMTIGVVLVCAVAQVLVHMVYFLHINGRAEEGWTLLSTLFTIIILVIVLSGSLWVMFHLNQNMMPQMDHEFPLSK